MLPDSDGNYSITLTGEDENGVSLTFLAVNTSGQIKPLIINPLALAINTAPIVCGDGVCEGDEDTVNCQQDCLAAPVPAASIWGLIALTLALLAGARIQFRDRLASVGRPDTLLGA